MGRDAMRLNRKSPVIIPFVKQRGRLGPRNTRQDVRDSLARGGAMVAAPMGTMTGTMIQDEAGSYIFMCGRSVCGGPDVCGD